MMRYLLKAALIGGAVSFLIVPIVVVAATKLLRLAPQGQSMADLLNILVLVGSFSAAIFIVVGIPMLAVYRQRNWVSWPMFAFGGVLVAILGEGLLAVSGIGYWDITNVGLVVQNTAMLAAGGFCAGTIFWAIARGSSLFARR